MARTVTPPFALNPVARPPHNQPPHQKKNQDTGSNRYYFLIAQRYLYDLVFQFLHGVLLPTLASINPELV